MDEDFQGLNPKIEEYYSLEDVFRLTNAHNFIKLTPQELINFAEFLISKSQKKVFPVSTYYTRIETLLKQFCLYPEKISNSKLIDRAISLSEKTQSIKIKTRLMEIKVVFWESTNRINKAIDANNKLINYCLEQNFSLNKAQAIIKGTTLAKKALETVNQVTEADLEDFIASLNASRITETDILELFSDVITPQKPYSRPIIKIPPENYLYGDEEINKINDNIKGNKQIQPQSFLDKVKDVGKKTFNLFSSWMSEKFSILGQ